MCISDSTQANQQRTAHARTDHAVGFAATDHRPRVGAVQFLDRALRRAEQVIALGQVVMDQVGDDFGVGLRFEGVAQRLQARALFLVVLDDAVVDQGHAVADVRMRVGLGDATMGGPAGVADAEVGMEAFGQRGAFHFRCLLYTSRCV